MDLHHWLKRINFGKYKYVLIVLAVGMVLMMLPDTNEKERTVATESIKQQLNGENTEQRLEKILAQINGAGNVKVMLSILQGERTIYQTDINNSSTPQGSDSRVQTVLITDSSRNQTGLIQQTDPPLYQGAIVLAQGGNDPVVKLAIVDAVSKVTGLGADRIAVLEMK